MMLSVSEVIERIKDVISEEVGNKKVFDKIVAQRLGLSRGNLTLRKRRNVMPMQEIAVFCAKRKICINWLLFDQKPEELREETDKHIITLR